MSCPIGAHRPTLGIDPNRRSNPLTLADLQVYLRTIARFNTELQALIAGDGYIQPEDTPIPEEVRDEVRDSVNIMRIGICDLRDMLQRDRRGNNSDHGGDNPFDDGDDDLDGDDEADPDHSDPEYSSDSTIPAFGSAAARRRRRYRSPTPVRYYRISDLPSRGWPWDTPRPSEFDRVYPPPRLSRGWRSIFSAGRAGGSGNRREGERGESGESRVYMTYPCTHHRTRSGPYFHSCTSASPNTNDNTNTNAGERGRGRRQTRLRVLPHADRYPANASADTTQWDQMWRDSVRDREREDGNGAGNGAGHNTGTSNGRDERRDPEDDP
jgi:hypothetical protein